MVRALLVLICSVFLIQANAQSSYREVFTQANLLTEDGIFGMAIPLWEQLLAEKPNHANINYKLGRCYLGLGIDRQKALPYLKAASKDINKNYNPYMFDVPGAPSEVLYYLGKAYHLNADLDSAEIYYQNFLDKASKKHFLRPEAEKGLIMCANARELMKSPIDVTITSIGKPINSDFSDYAPIVSLDENTLYFTSRRLRPDGTNADYLEGKTGLYFEDMYVSYRTIDGRWMNPELLNINSKDEHSSVLSMSPNGQQLYLYKTYNGVGNLYESNYLKGSGWQSPSLIGGDVNSASNEYYATITPDGERLYFVSDREGGMGGKDIWYSKKLPNGAWGKPLNLGAPINTTEDEDAPYLHPDGKTMYFSSNGHKSMGGFDIFYTQRDDAGAWQAPVNIGYPINTTDDDVCFITTPSGNRAYYSSRSADGKSSTDIYVVDFKDEAQTPEFDLSTFAVLKGWVLAPKGTALPKDLQIDIFNASSNELVGTATPVSKNGSFVFIIPSGNTYKLEYLVNGEIALSETVAIPLGTEYQEVPRELFLKPSKEGNFSIVSLDEKVLGNVLRWRLQYATADENVPIGTKVYFYDEEGNVTDTVLVSKDGYFLYKKLDQNESYILKPVLDDKDSMPLVVKLMEEGDVAGNKELVKAFDGKYYEKGKAPKAEMETAELAQKEEPKSGDNNGKGAAIADTKPTTIAKTPDTNANTIQKATGAKEFHLFYDYNQVEMEDEDPTFAAAMAAIRDLIAAGKTPKVSIEASASQVPTSIYSSNKELAAVRLNKIKTAVSNEGPNFSFNAKDLIFKDLVSLVQGPQFDSKANTPKALFIEYQYVRIIVN